MHLDHQSSSCTNSSSYKSKNQAWTCQVSLTEACISTSSHTVGLSQGRLLNTSSECTMVLINWWASAMFDNWEEY